MNKIINTILLTIIVTILFLNIRNKSNISKKIIIPIMTALIIKYVLGDWDSGYRWTNKDIIYWITILLVSYITIQYH